MFRPRSDHNDIRTNYLIALLTDPSLRIDTSFTSIYVLANFLSRSETQEIPPLVANYLRHSRDHRIKPLIGRLNRFDVRAESDLAKDLTVFFSYFESYRTSFNQSLLEALPYRNPWENTLQCCLNVFKATVMQKSTARDDNELLDLFYMYMRREESRVTSLSSILTARFPVSPILTGEFLNLKQRLPRMSTDSKVVTLAILSLQLTRNNSPEMNISSAATFLLVYRSYQQDLVAHNMRSVMSQQGRGSFYNCKEEANLISFFASSSSVKSEYAKTVTTLNELHGDDQSYVSRLPNDIVRKIPQYK